MWSDNGKNFVGANRELKDLYKFLAEQKTKGTISDFCASRNREVHILDLESGQSL